MSRFISLSSTSKILCMMHIRNRLKRLFLRHQRSGRMGIGPPAPCDQRHPDREAAALSERAVDRDLSTHQFAELLAERQPQPGAAVFAGAGIVRHGEFFEKMRRSEERR